MALELLNSVETTALQRTVAAAQDGDRQAFGRLVERFQPSVYAIVLRRLGNEAEAQELCQEVFVRALRKIGQLRDPACFGGWLRSIARRMAINRAVRRGRAVAADTDACEAAAAQQATPLGAALAHERQTQVRQGLGRLSTLDRETLVAFYFQGHSLVEMSRTFASPVGTIKRRLHVARQRLAKELAGVATAE